jgi:hypothetical protein
MIRITSVICCLTTAAALAAAEDKNGATAPPKTCKESDVVCKYIEATRLLLGDYRVALQAQVKLSRRTYAKIGAIAEQGRRDEIDITLRNERNRRSEELADAFAIGAKPVSRWKEYLLDYAALDFRVNREMLELESTDGSRYLQGLQNLQIELAKAQALDEALESLNKKESLIARLKQLGEFGQSSKTEFDKLVCGGLKKDLEAKKEVQKVTTAELATLKAQPQSTGRDDAIKKKEADKTAADDAVKRLSDLRTKKECKD